MKRHVAAVVVVLTTLLVVDNHVDWVHVDQRPLLEVNGQPLDIRGWAAEQALQWRRDCRDVPALALDSPTALAMLRVVAQHSLPDSRSASAVQVRQLGEWGVAEVTFETLNPSLVVLRWQDPQWRVQDRAVWSGSTAPWQSADFVRRYLRQQVPQMPDALIDCIDIAPSRYGIGPGTVAPNASARP